MGGKVAALTALAARVYLVATQSTAIPVFASRYYLCGQMSKNDQCVMRQMIEVQQL
jgi:hypothetical protein